MQILDNPCIKGHQLGEYTLTFMEDYYTELEKFDVDEEQFYPPPMAEVYREVNLRSFIVDDEEEPFDEDPIWLDPEEDSKNGILNGEIASSSRMELYNLSLNSLGDRTKLQGMVYPLGRRIPERMVPLEPHRSHFYHVKINFKISTIPLKPKKS